MYPSQSNKKWLNFLRNENKLNLEHIHYFLQTQNGSMNKLTKKMAQKQTMAKS